MIKINELKPITLVITDIPKEFLEDCDLVQECYSTPTVGIRIAPEDYLNYAEQLMASEDIIFAFKRGTFSLQVCFTRSELIFRRILRRIADETIGLKDVAIYYFNSLHEIIKLELNEYGAITNYQDPMFGADLSLHEMTETIKSQMKKRAKVVKK